jgi:hypothetical protein
MDNRVLTLGLAFLFLFSALAPISTGYYEKTIDHEKNYDININSSEDFESCISGNMGSFDGYTLFTPWFSTKTYLIDSKKRVVHKWKSQYFPALSTYLLENGNLLRSDYALHPGIVWGSGDTGRVEMFDWNNTLLWNFVYADDQICLHHDIEPLPNGNVLMIAWETKSREDAIAAGCNPELIQENSIWVDHVIEVEPVFPDGGNIVWEWHVWDHLIQDHNPGKDNYGTVEEHPELIDINFMAKISGKDWNHVNAIDYNEEFDQILLTPSAQGEIWIIDHSTTTEEARGHTGGNSGKGGDLLYRWGNPQSYRAGDESDQRFYSHHDARWIEQGCPGEGHITIFHNGFHRPGEDYSEIFEIEVPVDNNGNYYLEPGSAYDPKELFWTYTAKNPTSFHAVGQSGAQRLPNGNTMICSSYGYFFEVTPDKQVVWRYLNIFPNLLSAGRNMVFKINSYPKDYPGIGKLIKNRDTMQISQGSIFELNMPIIKSLFNLNFLEYMERYPTL